MNKFYIILSQLQLMLKTAMRPTSIHLKNVFQQWCTITRCLRQQYVCCGCFASKLS